MKVKKLRNKVFLEETINKMSYLKRLYKDLEQVQSDEFERVVIDTGLNIWSMDNRKDDIKNMLISDIKEDICKTESELANLWKLKT